ncbi:hypothetical protein [Pseudoalteromonas obscura]|uniref:Uncharacterized protein n=1 Tax=Pseudoalteromonas obscura TaxID=3048491 RepID=A0ABT7EFT1_9GAMM|nr:hypothetical protein [Pseudoalteromonas sp. P94(2023)]MDK2594048.1 hypothetical protein [Pseudoalteromonas sp. P94(2023)]
MNSKLEFNGAVPDIEGKVVSELFCIEIWHNGELEEPANEVYLKVGDSWYRHYFDCGIIFWRSNSKAPASYCMDELGCYFKVVNLKEELLLTSLTLTTLNFREILGGSESTFTFSDGRTISFLNVDDITSYQA